MVKVPRTPPHPLHRTAADIHAVGTDQVLWRVHATGGEHVLPWNQLRYFGPVASRFDPHPGTPATARVGTEGVLYAATDDLTAVAEVFQATRVIDPYTDAPHLTGWRPARPLRLLDLTGTWALRNGAAAALTAAPKPVCRAWAHEIRAQFPDLDGLWFSSTMTNRPVCALFTPAADAFPAAPVFSRPLAHPALLRRLVVVSMATGYRLAAPPE